MEWFRVSVCLAAWFFCSCQSSRQVQQIAQLDTTSVRSWSTISFTGNYQLDEFWTMPVRVGDTTCIDTFGQHVQAKHNTQVVHQHADTASHVEVAETSRAKVPASRQTMADEIISGNNTRCDTGVYLAVSIGFNILMILVFLAVFYLHKLDR